jgi:transcriptional regulator with XRE-family HTH domain
VNPKHDLSAFQTLNEEKVPWSRRAQTIKEVFPSARGLDWKSAFDRDMDLLGRVLRDILKVDQTEQGRPGPRPSLDYEHGTRRLRQILGEDYSMLPFSEAFKILAGTRSVRHLSTKTGLSKSNVQRLLEGNADPDIDTLQRVAQSFEKHPSFFLEYRLFYIARTILDKLSDAPEATINIYRKCSRP